MFDIGFLEFAVLAVVALFIFGPEQLPKIAADAGRTIRDLRRLAAGARRDLKEQLGPEFADIDLQDLNPRGYVRRNLLGDLDDLDEDWDADGRDDGDGDGHGDERGSRSHPTRVSRTVRSGERPPYDPDAT